MASILAVSASLYAFFNWLKTSERRRLESERQLTHALNNFAAVSSAINQLHEQMEEQTVELAQIKILLNMAGSGDRRYRGVK